MEHRPAKRSGERRRLAGSVGIADPNAYDLVINIARTTPRAIVEMLTPLLREKAILAERARSHAPVSNASPATARASAVSTR